MRKKIVTKRRLHEPPSQDGALAYWLSKTPEERVATVDYLRRQYYGRTARLQRVDHVLNAHSVEYMIVGGYALAFHGVPRFTSDLDILIKPDSANARRSIEALEAFGFILYNNC